MEQKSKPETDNQHHARKCRYCDGTGKRVIGYKEPKEVDCYYCNGKGWKIVKSPKHSDHVERPVFVESDYSKDYRATTGRMSPSDCRSYAEFRVRLKSYLLSKRGNKCEGCGHDFKTQKIARANMQVHHIILSRDGGSDDDDNLLLLCVDCHQAKHTFVITATVQRLYETLLKEGTNEST